MFENIDIEKYSESIANWFRGIFWVPNTLYQGLIIVGAFLTATVVSRLIRKRLIETIDRSNIPAQAKRALNNFRNLIVPLITLVLVFIVTRITSSEMVKMDVAFSEGVMKLLLAWIIIRMTLEFIANGFVRNFFVVSIWVVAALSIFGVLDETSAVLDAVGVNLGEFRLSALALIKGVLALFILLYLAIFVSSIAERRVFQTQGLTRSSQVLIAKIIRITLVVFALLIGIASAGIDLSIFAIFGGAVGLGIGFGLQKGVSNLFSGILLLLDKSIEPGDVLEMENGTFGWVQHMGARYTEVVTRDNKSFLIPNEDFITQRVVNWSHHGNKLIRLEVEFGVHYRHNPHEIKRIAEEAALNAHERICHDTEPICHLVEFGESSINFKLRFCIKDAEKGVTNIRSAVMLALWDAFQEHHIQIPYPQREISVTERKS
jgi:small-conductance mechanosensitive channel